MRKYLPLLVFLFSIPVLGQQRAVITGHVQTPNGASAAGVSILAAQSANRLMNAIGTTDESGNFRIENLNPGRYVILAGATVASVNEAGETMQVVVVSRPMPFYLFSNVGRATTQGTFYPGTDNLEEASEITVSAGETLENVNITLAQGPNPPMEVPMRILTGRFIAESGDTPTIGSNELTFMISDSPANLYSEVTFRGGFQPGANLTRLQTAGGPKALSSVLGMPSSPDGKFRLL
ncbi:MAG TPA: carboxypeptidase-like regulatory domain-containing protein, partial [Terriglobia bacterium]|nr:carboxypeptidase-like regulatory domain-containing protein [Terriglobia bacterium]